jgi:hypothetical protein
MKLNPQARMLVERAGRMWLGEADKTAPVM